MVGFQNVIKKIVKITDFGLVLGCTIPNHKALGAEQVKPSHRALVNHIRVLQELKEYFETGKKEIQNILVTISLRISLHKK